MKTSRSTTKVNGNYHCSDNSFSNADHSSNAGTNNHTGRIPSTKSDGSQKKKEGRPCGTYFNNAYDVTVTAKGSFCSS